MSVLTSFFYGIVKDAPFQPTDLCVAYTVGVFDRFADASTAFSGVNYREPVVLFDYLERYVSCDSERERTDILQHLGDLSLFLLALVPQSLRGKETYVSDVGSSSYNSLSSLKSGTDRVLFEEMSDRLPDLAEHVFESLYPIDALKGDIR